MKKKLLLSLCLILLVIFYGCSSDKNNEKATHSTNEKNNIIENQIVNDNEKYSTGKKTSDVYSIETDDNNVNNKMQDIKSYIGSWKISKYICAGIGIYSQDEIESFIGKTVTFSDETANYFEEQRVDKMSFLENPIYEENDMTIEEYLNEYKLSNNTVGLNGTTVKQIDIMDENKDRLLSLLKDDNGLFIHLPGVFLKLEKVN
ncbi:hypothetical protein [Clostridium sp. UBA6640]|uniref:hypothetical protein n=1 Tax=Clostridium sp. UBA6640 TaxID=1946370 RepID=UPI0025BF7F14|nr:hypothetical protein [Clostridium sp. UBA6640]